VTSGSSAASKISLPASFDGYYRIGNSARIASGMREMMSGLGVGSAMNSATFGFYSHDSGDQPSLIVVALPTSSIPSSSRGNISSQLGTFGASVQSYPSGPHGGQTDCGEVQAATVSEVLCAWQDAKTSGVVVAVLEQVTPDALAKIDRDLRDFID
jgi:hypothetical protein